MEMLSISTNLLVTPPEFSGTAQADEYTLRRNKAAQTASVAATRSNPAVPTRGSYATPATAYNSQAYNRNLPATAYATRAPHSAYNTPRAGPGVQTSQYTQPSYRAATGYGPATTIQQYQRQVAAASAAAANGYSLPLTPTGQPYPQRPAQSNYQQRAQDNGIASARNDSPQRALSNGQTASSQQSGQYVRQSSHGGSPNVSQAELNQRMTDSVKLLQQQSRQASGTPQPLNGVGVNQQQVANVTNQ